VRRRKNSKCSPFAYFWDVATESELGRSNYVGHFWEFVQKENSIGRLLCRSKETNINLVNLSDCDFPHQASQTWHDVQPSRVADQRKGVG
jgi:hypothetical protein